MEVDPTVFNLIVFVLAIFVGYYVVWAVTPALHTPLMSVTNAISSVIVVGALIATGAEGLKAASVFGFIALVTLAGVEAMAMRGKGQVRAVSATDLPAQRLFVHQVFGLAS